MSQKFFTSLKTVYFAYKNIGYSHSKLKQYNKYFQIVISKLNVLMMIVTTVYSQHTDHMAQQEY